MSLSGKKGSAQHFHEGNYTKIVQTCKRSWSTMFVESCDLDTPSINQGRVHDNMAFIYKQHLLCWNHSCLDNFLKIYPSQSQSSIPLLTLQVCPSSRAALWASTGLSMTRPVRPEKSMATKEFSDTLRCKETSKGGRVGGGWWAGGGGTQGWWWWGGVDKGQRSNKPDTVTEAWQILSAETHFNPHMPLWGSAQASP